MESERRSLRVYVDASVFGGCFDREFASPSQRLLDIALGGQIVALISDTLVAELASAPPQVQDLLEHLLAGTIERLALSEDAVELRDAYLAANVLSPKWSNDALHVAQASVASADVIASWNFKHLVNPMRVRGFNSVNMDRGYGPVVILTPEDVFRTWKEQDNGEDN